MKKYSEMNLAELAKEKENLFNQYNKYKAMNLTLNMARGKPSPEQLDMCMPLLNCLSADSDCKDSFGVDCRNYGELTGIKEAKELFGKLLGTSAEETIVVGSSSLTFMYDCIARAMLKGVLGSEKPWCKYDKIKFICPVPGYDRHFTILEFLGIEMISVPLTEWGPDMDMVRKYVENDETVKGMWLVPVFSNPMGCSVSNECVKQLAALKPAAKDFRLFWDNAYCVHKIYKDPDVINILDECKKSGNPDMVYMFGSTSKITMAGSGVAFFGASEANIRFTEDQLKAQAISWDKMNMLRHVRYLKSIDGIHEHMEKHAAILRPKFDAVLETLEKNLAGKDCGTWTTPDGGYFIMFIANSGCATRINELVKDCGLTMTGPGSTHPYHKDPDDKYLRIAPSYPSVEDLRKASEIFALAAQIATIEKLEKSHE